MPFKPRSLGPSNGDKRQIPDRENLSGALTHQREEVGVTVLQARPVRRRSHGPPRRARPPERGMSSRAERGSTSSSSRTGAEGGGPGGGGGGGRGKGGGGDGSSSSSSGRHSAREGLPLPPSHSLARPRRAKEMKMGGGGKEVVREKRGGRRRQTKRHNTEGWQGSGALTAMAAARSSALRHWPDAGHVGRASRLDAKGGGGGGGH
ncbi:U1 small nuclear ribonucleoprotein 70 kDa-like [Pantherophis guttatus]|uniref:U1 small nuclear ribonucleoprotein 70 kDa-like n=1 Tax=Pantherophis guttatus TaxID=94885 RepID=A0ABM3YUH0_PANGU|nr:U1 small nuclear ribonucleoprotein 70 kDa-like [Pantherophis guttatus]